MIDRNREVTAERIEILETEVSTLREQLRVMGLALESQVQRVKELQVENTQLLLRLNQKEVAP